MYIIVLEVIFHFLLYFLGDTGPLVYPAGFVYVYSVLYYATSYGQNIRLAQYIFLIVYIAQLFFTFEIFKKSSKIPPYGLILTTLTSYRIHSIYVLRLFNDPIAVLLFYISLYMFLNGRWYLGSLFYSLAVSVKMNILLYAPALLIAYLVNLTYMETFRNLFICGITQLILGAPFLYYDFKSYLIGSFDFGRVFEHRWTVNFRFLDRSIFENKIFHLSMLALHLIILMLFVPSFRKYFNGYSKLVSVINDISKKEVRKTKERKEDRRNKGKVEEKLMREEEKLSKEEEKFLESFKNQMLGANKKKNRSKETIGTQSIEDQTRGINFGKVYQLFLLPFFVCNLIGISCARSLHYQFYCWYYNSLIYLIYCTHYTIPQKFLLLGLIEYCWNVYPSTNLSSVLLNVCHVTLLIGLYKYMRH